jgi:hypothetical protein
MGSGVDSIVFFTLWFRVVRAVVVVEAFFDQFVPPVNGRRRRESMAENKKGSGTSTNESTCRLIAVEDDDRRCHGNYFGSFTLVWLGESVIFLSRLLDAGGQFRLALFFGRHDDGTNDKTQKPYERDSPNISRLFFPHLTLSMSRQSEKWMQMLLLLLLCGCCHGVWTSTFIYFLRGGFSYFLIGFLFFFFARFLDDHATWWSTAGWLSRHRPTLLVRLPPTHLLFSYRLLVDGVPFLDVG